MGNYLEGYEKDVCGHCNIKRTAEGHDGCIGVLPNVMNACCGHGENNVAYVQFNHKNYANEPNKKLIKGEKAIKYINENKLNKYRIMGKLLTDDMDIRDTTLDMYVGGNGDYYLELKETKKGEIIKIGTRISMSGGNATPEVRQAIVKLYRALKAQR